MNIYAVVHSGTLYLQLINLSSPLAQRSGIPAPDRNKESEKYDKYAANDLFDILNSWRIINIRIRNGEKDWWSSSTVQGPRPNKHPVRSMRSIRTEMGSERNCWLSFQVDPSALTGWLRRCCVGISLISDWHQPHMDWNQTQITLAINHTEISEK